MAEDDRRYGWGWFWLASGICAVIALIAAPPVPWWSVTILLVFAWFSFVRSFMYFGWIRFVRAGIRRSAALLVLISAGIGILGYKVWPHIARELAIVMGNYDLADPGNPVKAVRLYAYLLDWPATQDDLLHGRLSVESLFHWKLDVTRVDSLVGDNGIRETTVMHIETPEWNNADATRQPSEWIPLERDATVFTYRAEARESSWGGYIILRKVGDKLEREEAVAGRYEGEPMAITIFHRWDKGKLTMECFYEYHKLTNERLRELEVPVGN